MMIKRDASFRVNSRDNLNIPPVMRYLKVISAGKNHTIPLQIPRLHLYASRYKHYSRYRHYY
jgi:hypothetical protein